MKQRPSYDRQFRADAVRLAITGEKNVAETAGDLGINESTLYNWITRAKRSKTRYKGESSKVKTTGELMDELNQLRKENARLKEEREILKKAAAFFAKEEQKL